MLNGAIQTHNWLPPMSPNDEPRQHGRAEPGHHHYISYDSEDYTDIDADADDSSPEAIVEPLPSLKRRRSRLASGPPSGQTLNPNEVKKVKACIRCRMQKMKVSHRFCFALLGQLVCFWQLILCGSVNLTQRTFWEIAWGAETTRRRRKRRFTGCHVIAARSQTPSCTVVVGFSLLTAGEAQR